MCCELISRPKVLAIDGSRTPARDRRRDGLGTFACAAAFDRSAASAAPARARRRRIQPSAGAATAFDGARTSPPEQPARWATARALHNDCGLRVDRGQCHLGVPFGLRACDPALRFEPRAVARRASTPQNLLMPSRTRSLARSRVLCSQALGVAVSGSYAYVTAHFSKSLVVVDISNPASPAVRGSVVSSSLLNGVREAGELRARMA